MTRENAVIHPFAQRLRCVATHGPQRMLAALAVFVISLLALPVHAAISIPETPMQTNNGVPPNIWFILDDSGSMSWRYMYNTSIANLVRGNGTVVSTRTGDNKDLNAAYGPDSTDLRAMYDQNHITNTVYYNANNTYRGWRRADGSYMPDASFTVVSTSDTVINAQIASLAGTVQTFYMPPITGDLIDARLYTRYTFLVDGTAQKCTWNAINVGFSDCMVVAGFTWPSGATRTLAQEKTNFANWYSYHRTRSKLAKAGASYAFNDETIFNADSSYRVGFTTIWQRNEFRIPVGIDNGLFRGGNRDTWFNRLFNATADDVTPLIPALTRAGNYFSETGVDGPWGPQAGAAQYACRQNFTILTTDGYWNRGTTTVGNVDSTPGPLLTSSSTPPETYQYAPAMPYRDGWSNTLADVAMHYWKNDLRTDLVNAVPSSASNPAFWQHMVTFGISIGLKGTLDPKADLAALLNGTKTWPNPMDYQDVERIDDLFHAAVNGRGAFVSASNPDEFADGLGDALLAIASRPGTGSNASVAGTSTAAGAKVFLAKFVAAKWYGVLQAHPVTPAGVGDVPLWTASFPNFPARRIFTYNGIAGASFPSNAQQTVLGAQVADYLRGDRSQEPQVNAAGILRNRTSLLGDIVNSSPVYVKTASAAAPLSTVETVYVGANDGMLHAFDGATGVERFAYVPNGIDFLKLRRYASPDYNHHFFVDGPIVVHTDREQANRTILAGALGRGGRGLYALDVTDPTTFDAGKVLWEKSGTTEPNLGQVLGAPFVAKLNNGRLGLVVGNGINSSTDRAVLFVYDLATGAKLKEIDTNASGTGANGLSAPNGWDDNGDGTIDYVYAGDLRGNVWKFDLSSANASTWGVTNNRPLYEQTSGVPQPISGGLTIGFDSTTYKRWIFFGTGRLMTLTDLTDNARQGWYGIIDDPAANTTLRRSDLTARDIAQYDPITRQRAFETYSALPFGSKGWYIDLDLPPGGLLDGERMIGEPQMFFNVLIASSIIPNTANPCIPGRGYLNAVDAFTGTSVREGVFDVNRNGSFGDDLVGGTLTGSYDPGVGLLTDPVLVDGLALVNGALGPASVPMQGFFNGRIAWREIVRN